MSGNAGRRVQDEGLENLLEGHASTETVPTGGSALDAPSDRKSVV